MGLEEKISNKNKNWYIVEIIEKYEPVVRNEEKIYEELLLGEIIILLKLILLSKHMIKQSLLEKKVIISL